MGGLLAGVALLHIYISQKPVRTDTFFAVYGPVAGETQRMFYILSTLSFVGASEKLHKELADTRGWARKSLFDKSLTCTIFSLYLVALFFTVCAMPHEAFVSHSKTIHKVWWSR